VLEDGLPRREVAHAPTAPREEWDVSSEHLHDFVSFRFSVFGFQCRAVVFAED
jgi:hypothetical protein